MDSRIYAGRFRALATLAMLAAATNLSAQVQLSGRLTHPRYEGATDSVYLHTILCFASKGGELAEARSFRTWETDPAGWYRIVGDAGEYTVLFTHPSHYFRPLALQHVHLADGDKVDGLPVQPEFDYASFYEGAWDSRPAASYWQPFIAKGRSLTSVGFKLAHDGVDGPGPGSQNLVLSVHRQTDGAPDRWPQVGKAMLVPNVDCGGVKNYAYSAGWNSGEVPLEPGQTYAVCLRAEKPGGVMQTFWRTNGQAGAGAYRVDKDGTGRFAGCNLWMAVGTDRQGLVIPYNKKVHAQFKEFSGFASKWSQTYVARGRSLAGAFLYAAVGGAQPPLSRQRAMVRVRRGGPDGPVVGHEKLAIGNGNYTGDASWGMFGAVFASGETPVTPGETYAIEFESIENYETLHGFVNIKKQVSDDRPGFNPYRKVAPDTYEAGTAFKMGQERMPFDLDMQIIEYETDAVPAPGPDRLKNGEMETAAEGLPSDWKTFAILPETGFTNFVDGPQNTNHTARVLGGSATGKKADGGFCQRVEGLSRFDTYRLAGQLRSSWPVDLEHQCFVGWDPTGQAKNPQAETIRWKTLPPLHGVWVDYQSEPIRPRTNAVSVWLRARTTQVNDYRFTADFDHFSLRRIPTEIGASKL